MAVQRWQWIRTLSIMLLLTSLMLLIWMNALPWVTYLLAALGAAGVWGLLSSVKQEREQLKTANQDQMIQLIGHYRHDWMNEIQLLFGYVSLKKYDKLDDCLDRIRSKVQQESSIAKLGIPSLIAFFVSFRLYYNALALEVDMEEDINIALLPIDSDKVSRLVQMTVKLFHSLAVPSVEEPNLLSVQFGLEDEALLLDLVYQGGYYDKVLKHKLNEILTAFFINFSIIVEEYAVNQVVLTIRLPFTIKR